MQGPPKMHKHRRTRRKPSPDVSVSTVTLGGEMEADDMVADAFAKYMNLPYVGRTVGVYAALVRCMGGAFTSFHQQHAHSCSLQRH